MSANATKVTLEQFGTGFAVEVVQAMRRPDDQAIVWRSVHTDLMDAIRRFAGHFGPVDFTVIADSELARIKERAVAAERARVAAAEPAPPPVNTVPHSEVPQFVRGPSTMDLDIANFAMVGAQHEGVVMLKPPPTRMTSNQALVLAAWLVAIGELHSDYSFDRILNAVRNT